MKVITARIPEKELRDLALIEREEKVDRAEVVRKLLAESIKKWKVEKAISLLRERKATIRTAAKFAGISYAEMLDLAADSGIDIGYSLKDLQKDLQR